MNYNIFLKCWDSKQRGNKFAPTKAQKELTKLKQEKYAKNVHVSFPMSRLEFCDVIG